MISILIINYEFNPPKILSENKINFSNLLNEIKIVNNKVLDIENLVDGIHFTDSVLGIPRISSVTMANIVKKSKNSIKISCSVRTRDRNLTSMCQFVSDAINTKVDSLLIILGDQSKTEMKDNIISPSKIVRELNSKGFNEFIKINLSIPSKLNSINKIQKKIDANPNSFVTQSIESIEDLGNIVDIIKPYNIKVIACIMLPSKNNERSAKAIGLDWKEYEKEPIEFIRNAGKIADEILITSPNHFSLAKEILMRIKNF